ncbi:polysaccharide deacetylase family protein [Porticoccaceae bacterium]|nr:polysaccharide deacetylase family protein [Porticoccaceae bacterium]
MLNVSISSCCPNEQRYILDVILGEFLGLDFEVFEHDDQNTKISRINDDLELSLSNDFFNKAERYWLKTESMPVLPLDIWAPSTDGVSALLVDENIPVLYGQPSLIKIGNHWDLKLDIFGSAFFMLSRYEELITTDRDNHDRFPSYGSVGYKAGFLSRPIVNEYVEILWECIHTLWPDLQRKKRKGKNFITCDADWPFDPAIYSLSRMIKTCGRQILREYSPLDAIKTCNRFLLNKLGFDVNDQYRENISWMMDVNEQAGNKMAFYFITYKTSDIDTDEDFDSLRMRALFREIHSRGHELGLHPGYITHANPANFAKSVEKLRQVFKEENIKQTQVGGRMHFLRWDANQTPGLWNDHGFDYDSTLSYADSAGFRCGVCYDFTMYDLANRCAFRLKQRPLIVMECSVIAPRYENLGYSVESMDRFNQFKTYCRIYNGTYTFLWHNSFFKNKHDKIFYKELIK